MTPAETELRARFAEAAEREATRGAFEQPLTCGSDAAIALAGLFTGFPGFVRTRRLQEHRTAA